MLSSVTLKMACDSASHDKGLSSQMPAEARQLRQIEAERAEHPLSIRNLSVS